MTNEVDRFEKTLTRARDEINRLTRRNREQQIRLDAIDDCLMLVTSRPGERIPMINGQDVGAEVDLAIAQLRDMRAKYEASPKNARLTDEEERLIKLGRLVDRPSRMDVRTNEEKAMGGSQLGRPEMSDCLDRDALTGQGQAPR